MSAFNIKVYNKVTGDEIHVDQSMLEEGDTIETLLNLIFQTGIEFTDAIMYQMKPHPKMVLKSVELENDATYKVAFKTHKKEYSVKEVSEFMKEISEYNSFPNTSDPEMELIIGESSDVYFGQVSTIGEPIKKLVPHGYGKITTSDYVYTGLWFYGHMEGNGETIFNDGRIYVGNHVDNGITDGIEKSMHDNYTYEGSFYNYAKHGTGKELFPDGSVVEGEYVDDEFKKGVVMWQNGKIETGEFYVDEDGDYYLKTGTIVYPDGTIKKVE